ncbi:caldesmon 1a isoform X2 [Clupea harengus]|uniref:Caldesmon 1a isoform X2 n=1 Tax=Clupea harengus TaxID=7950 RepID=A0A6P8GM16_CLUHA|nr:caldesmon 1a isoform X2 [Clupea harengus]XP_042565941.1 caldesmon 1a isoform X2 [Clupea harengus]
MDDDFERRRELRRQKREEMRMEAESVSVSEVSVVSSSVGGGGGVDDEEEQALQDRLAKREERRLRRLKEAQERQIDVPETVATDNSLEERASFRRGRSYEPEPDVEPEQAVKVEREEEEEEAVEQEEEPPANQVEDEEREEEVPREVEKPRRSYRHQADAEEPALLSESVEEESEHSGEGGVSATPEAEGEGLTDTPSVAEAGESASAPPSEVDALEPSVAQNGVTEHMTEMKEDEDDEEIPEGDDDEGLVSQEDEDVGRKKESASWAKQQNGGVHDDISSRHKKPERTLSRGSLRSPEAPSASPVGAEDRGEEDEARLEAERKLEELRRKRDETESEEFERMRQKQQGAEEELEELKRKREERRKVLEEEERFRKHEEEERKAREEEEKRKMKEEIERRRAEAAEKRQKAEETDEGEVKSPFKCISPRGSSLKIGERAEFLNKSAQKSTAKAGNTPVVSKIDNRLEQYTSAVQSNRDARSPRSGASDLPVVTDGIRNIKSMWEKGNVFGSNSGAGSTNKDAAGIKVGVAGRINDWLNKTPEAGKTSGGRPVDLKPGDVTGKRSLWENIGSSPAKVTGRESKSVANGMGH